MKLIPALLALVLAPNVSLGSSSAINDGDEYAIKSAVYLNLLKLVEWPAAKQGDTASPFVIGITGSEEMARAIEKAAPSKGVLNGRPISVRRITGTTGLDECNTVFLGGRDPKQVETTLQALAKAPVLTVGESDRFRGLGGMINLTLSDGRIEIEVNLNVAEAAGLTVSSRLLKIAVVTKGALKGTALKGAARGGSQ
jgi:hypothetical protein